MIEKIKQAISEKRYGKLALMAIYTLAAIAAIVFVVFLIGKLIANNFETIVSGLVIVIVAYFLIHEFFASRKELRLQNNAHKKEVKEAAEKQQHEKNLLTAENNYAVVGKCLFTVLKEAGATLNLVPPNSLVDLEPQTRVSDNGGYVLLHYVCQIHGDVDVDLIKEVLNNRISQKLRADEFHYLSEPYCLYEGRSYPIIMVDDVVDVKSYVNIDMVMTNKAYCEHLRNKSIAASNYFATNDNDF